MSLTWTKTETGYAATTPAGGVFNAIRTTSGKFHLRYNDAAHTTAATSLKSCQEMAEALVEQAKNATAEVEDRPDPSQNATPTHSPNGPSAAAPATETTSTIVLKNPDLPTHPEGLPKAKDQGNIGYSWGASHDRTSEPPVTTAGQHDLDLRSLRAKGEPISNPDKKTSPSEMMKSFGEMADSVVTGGSNVPDTDAQTDGAAISLDEWNAQNPPRPDKFKEMTSPAVVPTERKLRIKNTGQNPPRFQLSQIGGMTGRDGSPVLSWFGR